MPSRLFLYRGGAGPLALWGKKALCPYFGIRKCPPIHFKKLGHWALPRRAANLFSEVKSPGREFSKPEPSVCGDHHNCHSGRTIHQICRDTGTASASFAHSSSKFGYFGFGLLIGFPEVWVPV